MRLRILSRVALARPVAADDADDFAAFDFEGDVAEGPDDIVASLGMGTVDTSQSRSSVVNLDKSAQAAEVADGAGDEVGQGAGEGVVDFFFEADAVAFGEVLDFDGYIRHGFLVTNGTNWANFFLAFLSNGANVFFVTNAANWANDQKEIGIR